MKARAGSYDRSTDLLLAGSRSSREPVDEGPVERAKRDPAAFGDLYDRYCGLIYRYVYSRVHERALAEDITEDVFFKALRHIHQYRNMGRPFSAWLYQIANRAVADPTVPAAVSSISSRRWTFRRATQTFSTR